MTCRSCGAERLLRFLSLGAMPLTDAYVPLDRADEPEARYPLDVAFCPSCTLVQLPYTVPPEAIFRELLVLLLVLRDAARAFQRPRP